MNLTKQAQTGRYGKKGKSQRGEVKGSSTEAPVQAACDTFVKMRHIDSLRISDSFWSYIHMPANRVKEAFKFLCSYLFAGWADNILFIPVTDKYSLAVFIENKSATGKWNGNEQKKKGERLNYVRPRSPEEVIAVIQAFERAAEEARKLLVDLP